MHDQQPNCLNSIRLMAALSVLISHSWPLTGLALDPLSRWTGLTSLGAVAVYVFFAISGYLVTQSAESRRSTFEFVGARFLRIAPGLVVCLLLTVVASSLFSTLPWIDYFSAPETRKYITHNITLHPQYILPGVFTANPTALSVNGSLWTLALEARLYAGLAILMVSSIFTSRAAFNALAIVFIFLCLKKPADPTFMPPEWTANYLFCSWCFLTGSVLYMNRDKIPLRLWVVILLWMATVSSKNSTRHLYLLCSTISYTSLWLGLQFKNDIVAFVRRNDISYGTYLYAYPVQQMFATNPAFHGKPFLLMAASAPLALALGYLSWLAIEKPAIELKKRVFRDARMPAQVGKPAH